MFDGWLRFDTDGSFAFSSEENGEIYFFIPKTQIGKVTYKNGGDREPSSLGFDTQIEAIEMSDWLAIKLAEEHELEVEK